MTELISNAGEHLTENKEKFTRCIKVVCSFIVLNVIKSSRDYQKNRKGDLLDEAKNSFAKCKKGKEEMT